MFLKTHSQKPIRIKVIFIIRLLYVVVVNLFSTLNFLQCFNLVHHTKLTNTLTDYEGDFEKSLLSSTPKHSASKSRDDSIKSRDDSIKSRDDSVRSRKTASLTSDPDNTTLYKSDTEVRLYSLLSYFIQRNEICLFCAIQ